MSDILLPDLSGVDRIAIDTETDGVHYGAKPVGLSWATPGGARQYCRWGHPSGNNCSYQQVKNWANVELSRARRPHLTVQLFNAQFDLRMLRNVDIEVTTNIQDVAFAAALLNEREESYSLEGLSQKYCPEDSKNPQEMYDYLSRKFGGPATKKGQGGNIHKADGGGLVAEYAIQDAASTLALGDKLVPFIRASGLWDVFALENELIPFMLNMYSTGVRVNVKRANEVQGELGREYDKLVSEWHDTYGNVNFGSTKQLAALFDRLGLRYRTTKAGNPSITKEDLENLDHPLGMMVRRGKKLKHMRGTFVQSYILDNLEEDGLIHPEFHQLKSEDYGTISGRFSSGGSMNAQNMPARDEVLAALIRGLFIPISPEHQWCKADYSQIEYRLFAHYAGGQIMRAYQENPLIDFHTMVAELTGLKRKHAKNVNFAILYGAGDDKTALTIGCTVEEAAEIKAEYFRRIPEALILSNQCMNKAGTRGVVKSWLGRQFRFPENQYYGQERISKKGNPYVDRNKFSFIHAALNRILQGGAADVMKTAMARTAKIVDWQNVFCHLTVHDELDFSVPFGEAGDKFMRQAKEVMEDFPDMRVPIVADFEVGESWGNVHEWKTAA